MLNKVLEKIDLKDLESLVQNSVAEGKSIEFKLSLPDDKDKKEFLADVSSFANTLGGDLIYGIKEKNGVAEKVEGLSVMNSDKEIRRYENLIRDGIEPRIQATFQPVKVNNEKIVLIIRVNKSWIGPHRVLLGHDKFYARNSRGKYPLDTAELRVAFNLSNTLAEKIRQFKIGRIAALMADDTPIPFYKGGKIILHLIPFEAFSPNVNFNIRSIQDDTSKLRPIYSGRVPFDHRKNLEGLLTYVGGEDKPACSYTQLYRNGIIEAVEGRILGYDSPQKYIWSQVYEKELLESLPGFLNVLRELNVNPPIFLFLTLAGVKGFKMDYDAGVGPAWIARNYPIDRDPLLLPECLIDTYDMDPKKILRPIFDLIWNTCGFDRSFNFDEKGEWTKRNSQLFR